MECVGKIKRMWNEAVKLSEEGKIRAERAVKKLQSWNAKGEGRPKITNPPRIPSPALTCPQTSPQKSAPVSGPAEEGEEPARPNSVKEFQFSALAAPIEPSRDPPSAGLSQESVADAGIESVETSDKPGVFSTLDAIQRSEPLIPSLESEPVAILTATDLSLRDPAIVGIGREIAAPAPSLSINQAVPAMPNWIPLTVAHPHQLQTDAIVAHMRFHNPAIISVGPIMPRPVSMVVNDPGVIEARREMSATETLMYKDPAIVAVGREVGHFPAKSFGAGAPQNMPCDAFTEFLRASGCEGGEAR
ncbi:hypothetical protein BDK51DRAFT_29767 [Blyttiomyces helicus]|uniref:Uncharacterized protein n=1 Tax=Blyttiomyces helicus TaxID=388810 RepID=A0A4P9WJV3_9FUNG|nr:hypothetical protein BDK51DRAFT_29767 [Blyttiomyces helicus]|eukprot:RKO91420.1 hypothetical protein BDK51DRAFT_29767 [Blyttiomyces helicus]